MYNFDPLSSEHSVEDKYNVLKQDFRKNKQENRFTHKSLYFLLKNKKNKTPFRSEKIIDNENDKFRHLKSQKLNFYKILTAFKKKIKIKSKKEKNSTELKLNSKNYIPSKFNSNFNKPRCNSTEKMEYSFDESFDTLHIMLSTLSKTFSQDYDDFSNSEAKKYNSKEIFNSFDSKSLEKTEPLDLGNVDSEKREAERFQKYKIPQIVFKNQNDEIINNERDMKNLSESEHFLIPEIQDNQRENNKKSEYFTEKENYILPVLLNEIGDNQKQHNEDEKTLKKKENKHKKGKKDKNNLILNDNEMFYNVLGQLTKGYCFENQVPKEYNLCYIFYIYMPPSQIDANLLLFRRHELKNMSKIMDPVDSRKLISDTKGDFLFDRRLEMVEIQCNCRIVLEPLHNVYINGLPYRLLNVYSSTYENIAKALSIMEEIIPEIMQTSLFKKVVPSTCSLKWSLKGIVVRPIRKPLRSHCDNKTWFSRMDQHLLFPYFNNILDSAKIVLSSVKPLGKVFNKLKKNLVKNNNSISKSEKTKVPLSRFSSNSPEMFYEIEQKSFDIFPLKKIEKNKNNSSKVSFTCRYLKRIKCPSSILQKDFFLDNSILCFLFDKFNCKIIKIEDLGTIDGKTFLIDQQVKLSISYHSRKDFLGFCTSLGLCNKHK